MFPLPIILQDLLNAEPRSAKLCAHLYNTRLGEASCFLTQCEVITSHLRNVILMEVLFVVLAHLPIILLYPGGICIV